MQIGRSLQNSAEIIRDVPTRLLALVAEGQRVQATVMAKLASEQVKLQIADTVIQLNSKQDLRPGQQLELLRTSEAGKPVFKIMTVTPPADPAFTDASTLLKPGQQLAVEVIKLLARDRLLVAPAIVQRAADLQPAKVEIPRQIEVDISALKQIFKPGDKLIMEVIQSQPLAIRLRADVPGKAELIQQFQRALLPQLERQPLSLTTLTRLPSERAVAEPVRQVIAQLLQGVTEKKALQQPDLLKQSLTNSGIFLENRLKTSAGQVALQQDLKANLLRLAQVLNGQIQQTAKQRLVDNPAVLNKLPQDVQLALKQVTTTPQALRPLPAQIVEVLANRGHTPVQLLQRLLTGFSLLSTVDSSSTSLSGKQGAAVATAQALITAREKPGQPAQTVQRTMELQLFRDLLREVETATARVQFNQLAMLRDSDTASNSHVWLFDLPVKDKQQMEMLQMRLEQHHPGLSGNEEAIWQVQLNLETQNLGPLQARISLHEDDVKVVLLAERPETATVLNRYIDELNQRLAEIGVSVSHLSCRQESVKPLTAEMKTELQSHLVDISV